MKIENFPSFNYFLYQDLQKMYETFVHARTQAKPVYRSPRGL
jgi:hypothetical protein